MSSEMTTKRPSRKLSTRAPRSDNEGPKNVPWKKLPKVPKLAHSGFGRGRPTKMHVATLVRIREACVWNSSPSYSFLARYLGVTDATFQRWLGRYVGLREKIERWRSLSLHRLRVVARKEAMAGDGKMLRFLLERRDQDFKPNQTINLNDVTPNNDVGVPRPEFG